MTAAQLYRLSVELRALWRVPLWPVGSVFGDEWWRRPYSALWPTPARLRCWALHARGRAVARVTEDDYARCRGGRG